MDSFVADSSLYIIKLRRIYQVLYTDPSFSFSFSFSLQRNTSASNGWWHTSPLEVSHVVHFPVYLSLFFRSYSPLISFVCSINDMLACLGSPL